MGYKYKGFSTQQNTTNFRLTDFELVKQDIINHFSIRKGEKLMRPNFGTVIWNVLFEPFTVDLKRVIIEDITNIAKYDPRVSFDNIVVTEYEQGILVEVQLRYLPSNQSSNLLLNFNNQTNRLSVV